MSVLPAESPPVETLILGIGNPLCGDDGAGICLAEMLAAEVLPTGVQVTEAGIPGWGLPSWLQGWSSVILLDAVEMGRAPGEWQRFEWGQASFSLEDEAFSLHQPDLACGLALTEALDLLPERLTIYAVQPANTEPGAVLSPQVSARLPELVDKILVDLGKSDQ